MTRKTNAEIAELCIKYHIDSYDINEDGSIDVYGDVIIGGFEGSNSSELELTFNKVSGSFYCDLVGLTTLKGCPREVGSYFDCSDNNLTSLEYCPDIVHSHFSSERNGVTSLDFFPSYIGGFIFIKSNVFVQDDSLYARLYSIYTDANYPKYPMDAMKDNLEELYQSEYFLRWVERKRRIDTIASIIED